MPLRLSPGERRREGRGLVILPTYNEIDALEGIVRRVLDQDPRFSVLIVDDGSPDGTGELADRMSAADPRISVMHREEKLGLITRRRAPGNKKNLYVYLTPKGRALKRKLVPLAQEVNAVAVEGVSDRKVEHTRQTLLAIIENLARDEAAAPETRRVPSTRELARIVSGGGRKGANANKKKTAKSSG